MKINKKIIFLIIVILIVWYFMWGQYMGKKFVNDKIDRDSKWYVNDLYMSNQYYYDHILSEPEKEIYETLFNDIQNMKKEISFEANHESVVKAIDALSIDHPELINLASYSYQYTDNTTIVKPNYITKSKSKLKKMVLKLQKTITKIEKDTRDMSEYEKEYYIYTWLGSNNRYRDDPFKNADQSAYTALMKGKNTVCAGFGRGAQILFQNVGIDSYILLSEDHIWNLVKIDEEYYYFDATNTYVANCYNTVSYSGLNTFYYNDPRYHELYYSNLPNPNGTKYNYYEYNNLVVDSIDDVYSIIENANEKEEFVEFLVKDIDMNDLFNQISDNKLKDYKFTRKGSYMTGGNTVLIKRKL